MSEDRLCPAPNLKYTQLPELPIGSLVAPLTQFCGQNGQRVQSGAPVAVRVSTRAYKPPICCPALIIRPSRTPSSYLSNQPNAFDNKPLLPLPTWTLQNPPPPWLQITPVATAVSRIIWLRQALLNLTCCPACTPEAVDLDLNVNPDRHYAEVRISFVPRSVIQA
jgi:hypothetical protein